MVSRFAGEAAQDARHTIRQWARNPWYAALAILALAIGMGANTGVFSVVNALLLRSLPFRDPERLASLQLFFAPHDSARQFHDWREQSTYLADAALWETADVNLDGAGEWQRARVAQTSWNFFSILGAQPVLGRAFLPGEEADGAGWGPPGSNAVAVIGYGLWQSLYGGDPKALGATIRVDGHALRVIGVAPPGFDYPNKTVIWKPAVYSEGNYGFRTVGRLKPAVTWEQAQGPFRAEADRLFPGPRRPGQQSTITPLRDELAGPTKNASLVLMACVGLILLIACANVANLLMARTADRAPELSLRSALGASRARITRQLLVECMLLSLAAALVGLTVASSTASVAARLQPAVLSKQAYSLLDTRVLCFAIAISLFSGLLFGLLPSLYAGRVHTFGTRGSSDTRGSRLIRESLVAAQVMLTIVLVVASISLDRAFLALMQVDRGFDRTGVVTAMVSLQGTPRETDASRQVYFREALDRLRQLPWVRSASSTQFLPLDAEGFIGGRFRVDGVPASTASAMVPVMPDYFRTMGGRIVAGREFTQADSDSNAQVAIVNQVFAGEFGQPADLIGRKLSIGSETRRIVGVVKGMDYVTEGAQSKQVFIVSRSPGWPRTAFVVKVTGRPEDHLAMIRDTIKSLDRQVPVFGVETMDQRMAERFARPQFYKTAVMFFAAFAFLLAIIGIHGIVSYTVARRYHEMGVRMALGITAKELRAGLVRQGLIPIFAGAVPGVAAAILTNYLLTNLVEEAKPAAPAVYAGSVLFIALIAAAGIWLATKPVTRLDIADILRVD